MSTSHGQIHKSVDKLWVPSHTEVAGLSQTYKDIDSGDVHFEYYKSNKQRVMCLDNSPVQWWERSPNISNSTNFMRVNNYGGPNYSNYASYILGIAFGFSI